MLTKIKTYVMGLVGALLLLTLTSCGLSAAYEQQGYTQKVIYDLGEGVCSNGSRKTNSLTVYYKPGSYITDFSESKDYTFSRAGDENIQYAFDGWCFDSEGTMPVDFKTYTLPEEAGEDITIYAKWLEISNKFFDIYYMPEGATEFELLTNLRWEMNEPFKYSEKTIVHPDAENQVYTYIEAYTDEEMTIPVTDDYVLTKDVDNLPIYTKWIKGNYKVINTANDFRDYFNRYVVTYNMYINADIDLTGITMPIVNLLSDKTILGNNHVISNMNYSTLSYEMGSKTTVSVGGLAAKMENCVIKDLSFVNATFEMRAATCTYLNFGLLAGEIVSTTIDNVNVAGAITYSEETLARLESGGMKGIRITLDAAYKIDENSSVTNFTHNITGIMEG